MRVTWEVTDGYCGKSSPHYTDIPDIDLERCTREEEKYDLIRECVQRDFEARISWEFSD